MGIHIIHKDFGDQFYRLLDSTQQEINIISPFIGSKTAESLAQWLEGFEDIECKVITRFSREEFIQGANSIQGLKRLVEAGAKCYALQNLHTKLYLFDNHSVIMGSANFTFHGFYKNHEFGLYMEDEPAFTSECRYYFDNILEQINKDWEITLPRIEKEITMVSQIRHERLAKKNLSEFNNWKWGAELNEPTPSSYSVNEKDFIEESISSVSYERHTGIWLKFEGTSENRIDNEEVYLERKRRLYESLNRTFFPMNPSSIKSADIVFIAVVSHNQQGQGVPLIVGYALTTGFRPENVIDRNDPNFVNWNDRFKYFVELTAGKFIAGQMKYGISLKELCFELKHKLYPSTVGLPNTKLDSILKRHHQKSHLQITPMARDYLIEKLDELFDVHGYEEF